MKPQDRSKEFREKLRQENPELAKKYERFLYAKSRCYTANYAYEVLTAEDVQQYIQTNIGPHVSQEEQRMILGVWTGHKKSSQKDPKPFLCLDALHIKRLDDILQLYEEFHHEQPDAKPKFKTPSLNFLEFLKQKVLQLPIDSKTRQYIQHQQLWELFPLEYPLDIESINNADPGGVQFYIDQYRRLEREKQVGTTHSEKLFLPLLQAFSNDCSTPSSDILSSIVVNTQPEITLTIDEMEDAILSSPDEEFHEFLGDFTCEKWKVMADLECMRTEIEQETKGMPEEDAKQYGQFSVERKQLMNFFGTKHFGYPQDVTENLWYAIVHNFGMKSPEGRLKFMERKLRESEQELEEIVHGESDILNYDSDNNPSFTDAKKDMSETAMRNRMVLELLRIYRRNKQEIGGIVQEKRTDDTEDIDMDDWDPNA